jgi:hypothetical protein
MESVGIREMGEGGPAAGTGGTGVGTSRRRISDLERRAVSGAGTGGRKPEPRAAQ